MTVGLKGFVDFVQKPLSFVTELYVDYDTKSVYYTDFYCDFIVAYRLSASCQNKYIYIYTHTTYRSDNSVEKIIHKTFAWNHNQKPCLHICSISIYMLYIIIVYTYIQFHIYNNYKNKCFTISIESE